MSAERAAIDVAKIEELLSQVRGVMAVRVVLEEQGQIDELHIVGSPGRSAKQMVRDIESLLYVRGGVRVDQRVQGVGRSRPDQEDQPEQLAGYATIHALDQLIGARGQFRLENMERQPFGQLEVYLTHLSLTTDDGIEMLLGISVVHDDDPAAVVRAILDAVNRRLQRLLGSERTRGG